MRTELSHTEHSADFTEPKSVDLEWIYKTTEKFINLSGSVASRNTIEDKFQATNIKHTERIQYITTLGMRTRLSQTEHSVDFTKVKAVGLVWVNNQTEKVINLWFG